VRRAHEFIYFFGPAIHERHCEAAGYSHSMELWAEIEMNARSATARLAGLNGCGEFNAADDFGWGEA